MASQQPWRGIDHISLSFEDYEASRAMYAAALKPLKYEKQREYAEYFVTGYGLPSDHTPSFWIGKSKPGQRSTQGVHLCLKAETQDEIKAFYEAAIGAGFTDNGAPGPRPHYAPTYWAAFVLDKEGNNIEAALV